LKPELLQGFCLGDLLIEPLKRQVTGRGFSVQLTSKASEVLLQLARAPSSLVTVPFLLEKVWGEGHGTPEELNQVVDEIFVALQDSIDDPQYIQILPQRGYRLIVSPRLVENHTLSGVMEATGVSTIADLHILRNLQQRGVLEAGLAYLIIGWLIIQLVDVIFDQLLLPQWAGTFVTVLVIAGFPITLVLSWYLEFRDGRAVVDTGSQMRIPRGGVRRTRLSIIGALVIASIGVFGYDRLVGLPEESVPTNIPATPEEQILPVEPNSIAVLKFLNVDGGERTEIFASGFAEEMINRLARLPTMAVASRGDSWSLGTSASSDEVRQRLRVAYYVEGSVRISGDSLSVNVRLIDSLTGFQMTTKSFDERLENFVEVQREITNLTVANLRVALPPETQLLLAGSYEKTDVDAYVLYRRGKEQFEKPHSVESLAEAVDLYERALEVDPDYAAAHAGLCVTYAQSYEVSNDASYIDIAETACASALAANPNLNIVHTALGDLYNRTGRDGEAEAAYLRALGVNDQDVYAMSRLAIVYEYQQRLGEAEDLLNQAIRLQPGNWRSLNLLGFLLFSNGRYLEAADAYREVVQLDPNNWQGHGNVGSSLLMAGQFVPAAAALERASEIEPSPDFQSNLAIIYYYLGQFDESVAIHRKAVELSPDANYAWLNLADALLFSNQSEQAQDAFRISAGLAEKNLLVNPRDAAKLYELAWATAMLGNLEYAGELINRSKSIDPNDPYVHYYDALLKTRREQPDAAVDALQRAIELGYPAKLLAAEPYLEDLYQLKRFSAMVARDQ